MPTTYQTVIDDVTVLAREHRILAGELARAQAKIASTVTPPIVVAIKPVVDPVIIDPALVDPITVDPIIIPRPAKPPTSTAGPWTHNFARMTMIEAVSAARLRVTPILRAAPAREDMGYDIVYPDLHLAGDNGTITNESRHGRWGKAYGCNKHYYASGRLIPRSTNLTMDNCHAAGPWDDQSSGSKWHVRMSNIPEATITRCVVIGETLKGRQSPKEHGWYLDMSGDATFADCLFEDIGGHGVYLTNRPEPFQQYGRLSLYFKEAPTWLCDNVIQIHNEQDASRSSFDFTFYDPGSYEFPGEVIIKDCASITAWPFQRSQNNNERHRIEPYIEGETRASGAMVVTNYVALGQRGWPTERIVLTRCVLWTVQARHDLALLRGAKDYLLKDSFFKTEGPNASPFIEIGARRGRTGFRGPHEVVIENCLAENVQARIWRDADNSDVIDLHTPGKRVTWTPSGVTVEAL